MGPDFAYFLTLFQMTNFKLKEFADDNFEFDENERKLSKRKKTLWEKEKLLVTSHFSFSSSVFKGFVLQTSKKHGLVWEGVMQVTKS